MNVKLFRRSPRTTTVHLILTEGIAGLICVVDFSIYTVDTIAFIWQYAARDHNACKVKS